MRLNVNFIKILSVFYYYDFKTWALYYRNINFLALLAPVLMQKSSIANFQYLVEDKP